MQKSISQLWWQVIQEILHFMEETSPEKLLMLVYKKIKLLMAIHF